MLLSSCSFGSHYGVEELPQSVLELFLELVDNPSKKVEFTSEIVFAGLEGRIYSKGDFCIDAYENGIRKIDTLRREGREKKRFVSLQNEGSNNAEEWNNGEINASYVGKMLYDRSVDDVFEQVLESSALQEAVDKIKALNEDFILEDQVDVIQALHQATTGEQSDPRVIKATEILRVFCEKYNDLAEYVRTVLTSQQRVEELFGLC